MTGYSPPTTAQSLGISGLPAYLMRQVAGPLVFFTVALTAIMLLGQSMRTFDLIVNKGLSLGDFLSLTALLLPSALALILPVALFCAVLFAFWRLATDSELIVMSAAGIGPLSLARSTMILGGVVALVVYLLNLYLAPLALRTFKDQVFEIRETFASILLQEGEFNTLVDGLTVYVRDRQGARLSGILVHDDRVPGQAVTMLAEQGTLLRTPEGPRFVLINGNRQQVDPSNGRLSLLYFERYSIDLSKLGGDPGDRWIEPSERYLGDLFFPDSSQNDQNRRGQLIAEGHRRLVTPLYAFAFALVGLVAVVGGEFDRRGRGRRLVLAAIAGVVIRLGEIGFASMAAQHWFGIVLQYLGVLVPIAACLAILAGMRLPRLRPSIAVAAPG
ncbi:LPS export ABC transporter permease LptF [Zavarzinia sp. CC-PAN008]|uniref:LPS export ABC transporter permease LptF n=1 Tax=Zavarzinia sp. CC-PAN008 TaxID=3243332 RepID=UPI003F742F1E